MAAVCYLSLPDLLKISLRNTKSWGMHPGLQQNATQMKQNGVTTSVQDSCNTLPSPLLWDTFQLETQQWLCSCTGLMPPSRMQISRSALRSCVPNRLLRMSAAAWRLGQQDFALLRKRGWRNPPIHAWLQWSFPELGGILCQEIISSDSSCKGAGNLFVVQSCFSICSFYLLVWFDEAVKMGWVTPISHRKFTLTGWGNSTLRPFFKKKFDSSEVLFFQ